MDWKALLPYLLPVLTAIAGGRGGDVHGRFRGAGMA